MYSDFLPLPLWLFWWHNNLWGWRKTEQSSGIYACRSVKVLDPFLHFGAAKYEHATLTIYRCSSTCWHLKTPSIAHIHHRTNEPKKNNLFKQLNLSRASWLSRKLCDFGSRGTRFEFHRGQLFVSASLFSQSEDNENFQSLSHVGRWPAHMLASEVYKNLPAGFYRDLQTCGQSMDSNGLLAVETSIKNLILHYKPRLRFYHEINRA